MNCLNGEVEKEIIKIIKATVFRVLLGRSTLEDCWYHPGRISRRAGETGCRSYIAKTVSSPSCSFMGLVKTGLLLVQGADTQLIWLPH